MHEENEHARAKVHSIRNELLLQISKSKNQNAPDKNRPQLVKQYGDAINRYLDGLKREPEKAKAHKRQQEEFVKYPSQNRITPIPLMPDLARAELGMARFTEPVRLPPNVDFRVQYVFDREETNPVSAPVFYRGRGRGSCLGNTVNGCGDRHSISYHGGRPRAAHSEE